MTDYAKMIENAARAIYELNPYAYDFALGRIPELPEIMEDDRVECIKQAKAALEAANLPALLEELKNPKYEAKIIQRNNRPAITIKKEQK